MKSPDTITVDILPNIVDVALLRNVQPDDVLVLTVSKSTTEEQAACIAERANAALPCSVYVVTDGVKFVSFTGDAE